MEPQSDAERYPHGYRLENAKRVLADGTVKVYQVKRPRGPGRQKKEITKKAVKDAISKLNDAQLADVADFISRAAMSPSPEPEFHDGFSQSVVCSESAA
jgi:hypothetical protein